MDGENKDQALEEVQVPTQEQQDPNVAADDMAGSQMDGSQNPDDADAAANDDDMNGNEEAAVDYSQDQRKRFI